MQNLWLKKLYKNKKKQEKALNIFRVEGKSASLGYNV